MISLFKKFVKKHSLRKILIFTGDFIFLSIAAITAQSFVFDEIHLKLLMVNPFVNVIKNFVYLFVIFVALTSFRYLNLYKEKYFLSTIKQLFQIVKGVLFSAIILIIIKFLIKEEGLLSNARIQVLLFIMFSVTLVYLFRLLYSKANRSNTNDFRIFKRNILAVGAGEVGQRFADEIKEKFSYLKLVGFIDEDSSKIEKNVNGVKVLGSIKDLGMLVEHYNIDEIFITINNIEYNKLLNLIEICKEAGCMTNLVSSHFGIIQKKFDAVEYRDLKCVPIHTTISPFYSQYLKRAIDIFVSGFLLILIFPVLFILFLMIKVTSKGPVLYRTYAIGKSGMAFKYYKLRTMYNNNDQKMHEEHLRDVIGKNKSTSKIENDPRVTAVGKLLRKYSLDELPQLINVLKGDMSLIGPRPCLPYEYELMTEWHKKRTKVVPGMSGLWQTIGRNKKDVSFNDSLILDLYYIDNISMWLDFKIIIRTIPVVIFGKGGG